MSTGIVDIEVTPDVATWNKKIHIKDVDSIIPKDTNTTDYTNYWYWPQRWEII
jgi:hypothetical protein